MTKPLQRLGMDPDGIHGTVMCTLLYWLGGFPGGSTAPPASDRDYSTQRPTEAELFGQITNEADRAALDGALARVAGMLGRSSCDTALANHGIPSLKALFDQLSVGRMEDGHAKGNIWDGRSSKATVTYLDDLNNSIATTATKYLETHRNVNAITDPGAVNAAGLIYLGDNFFRRETVDQRAITLLHEAVHAVALLPDLSFGTRDEESASRELTAILNLKCNQPETIEKKNW